MDDKMFSEYGTAGVAEETEVHEETCPNITSHMN
jgi:hypothetical protein